METITIHPRTKEEASLFEHLAKTLNTPYKIEQKENIITGKKNRPIISVLLAKKRVTGCCIM